MLDLQQQVEELQRGSKKHVQDLCQKHSGVISINATLLLVCVCSSKVAETYKHNVHSFIHL